MNNMFFYHSKSVDDCVNFLCMSPLNMVNILSNSYEVVLNKDDEVKDMYRCLWFAVKESSN